MKILWICNAWKKINNPYETTLRLMEEAILLGHDNWYCDAETLGIEEKRLHALTLRVRKGKEGKISLDPTSKKLGMIFFDKVFFRCDPPFKIDYFIKLKLLLIEIKKPYAEFEIINDPYALVVLSSKTCPELFEEGITAKTFFSCSWKELKKFGMAQKKTVAKPLLKGACEGVELLLWDSESEVLRSKKILKKLTSNFSEHILLQEYLDVFKEGEVRIWFACGEVVCVFKKIFNGDNFYFDTEKGDQLIKHVLTGQENNVAEQIAVFLKKENIKMAAVDLIDMKITDFNISSPGLIKECEEISRENYSKIIMTKLLGKHI